MGKKLTLFLLSCILILYPLFSVPAGTEDSAVLSRGGNNGQGDSPQFSSNMADLEINAYIRNPLDTGEKVDSFQVKLFDASNKLAEIKNIDLIDIKDTSDANNAKFLNLDNYVRDMSIGNGVAIATLQWRGVAAMGLGARSYTISWAPQSGTDFSFKDTVTYVDASSTTASIPITLTMTEDQCKFVENSSKTISEQGLSASIVTDTNNPNQIKLTFTNGLVRGLEWIFEGTLYIGMDKVKFNDALSGKYREVIVFNISSDQAAAKEGV